MLPPDTASQDPPYAAHRATCDPIPPRETPRSSRGPGGVACPKATFPIRLTFGQEVSFGTKSPRNVPAAATNQKAGYFAPRFLPSGWLHFAQASCSMELSGVAPIALGISPVRYRAGAKRSPVLAETRHLLEGSCGGFWSTRPSQSRPSNKSAPPAAASGLGRCWDRREDRQTECRNQRQAWRCDGRDRQIHR